MTSRKLEWQLVQWLWAEHTQIMVKFLLEAGFVLQSIQTSSGASPASYSMGTQEFFITGHMTGA